MSSPSKFLLICLLVLTAGLAKAQTATPSASHLKAAEALLNATDMAAQLPRSYSAIVDASSAQVPADKKAKFKEIMLAFLTKYMNFNAMKPDLVTLYAQEFTETELKQITQFYLTPAGKKVNERLPALLQKGMALGQQKMQAHLPEFQAELQKAFGPQ
ncbi:MULTISPECIES: DUF2059 domain-containing protein [unclassified Mucilaginibacter]|uniref:DUF2059 domain-containing protein n=1 Tax=unclassified Mucilaginibacter TaxID=2617802 RepID=UPI0031F6F69F